MGPRCFTNIQAANFVRQIAIQFKEMHETHKLAYRDLKMENVVLVNKPKDGEYYESKELDTAEYMLVDFGLSKQLKPGVDGVVEDEATGRSRSFSLYQGTAEYLAPEMLSYNGHSFEADIWTLGIAMYGLLAGVTPFHSGCSEMLRYSKMPEAEQKKYLRKRFSEDAHCDNPINENALNLVAQMLRTKPEERLAPDQILNHLWLFQEKTWVISTGEACKMGSTPSLKDKNVTIEGNPPVFRINRVERKIMSYGKSKNSNRISLELANVIKGKSSEMVWFSCMKSDGKWNPHCAEMLEVARHIFPVLKNKFVKMGTKIEQLSALGKPTSRRRAAGQPRNHGTHSDLTLRERRRRLVYCPSNDGPHNGDSLCTQADLEEFGPDSPGLKALLRRKRRLVYRPIHRLAELILAAQEKDQQPHDKPP